MLALEPHSPICAVDGDRAMLRLPADCDYRADDLLNPYKPELGWRE